MRAATGRKGLLLLSDFAAAGLNEQAMRHRIKRRRLFRVHRGVYSLTPVELLDDRARDLAAVLAIGGDARLDGHSCAAVWKFRPQPEDSERHVAVPVKGRRSRPGIKVRYGATDKRDFAVRDDIPILTAARTLLEIAPDLTRKELEQAIRKAQTLKTTTLKQLRDVIDRNPRHRGRARLADAIDYTGKRESPLEDRAWEFFKEAGLPLPEANAKVGGRRVDYLWRDRGLIVECDSREYHDNNEAFEEDRDRDIEHLVAGHRTVRITNRKLKRGRTRLAVQLAWLLPPQ